MISNRLKYIPKFKTNGGKRYYRGIKYPNIPVKTSDQYAITSTGDRLDLLANDFYGDIKLWWILVIANKGIIRTDSYALKGGLEIRIPQNLNQILRDFERVNNNL